MSEPKLQETPTEQLPLSNFYKVVDYINLFRSEKSLEATAVVESLRRRSISMYLWQKRRQVEAQAKFKIRNLQEW